MKRAYYYIGAVVIGILCLVLRGPRIQKDHEINKLKLEKEKIVAEISGLNSELDNLKQTREYYCGENSVLSASGDVIRSELSELNNSILDIDNKLIELLDIKVADSEVLLSEGKLLGNKYIVIHHTATSKDTTIQEIKDYWQRKYNRPAAHIVIDYSGNSEVVYDINKNAGSTMNNGINNYALQIELIGNFNEHKPSLAQYRELQDIIALHEENNGEQKIIGHRDASPTACPGKLFDFSLLEKDLSGYVEFELSRYYSPQPNQTKYFSSIDGFYSQEYLDRFSKYERGYEMDVCMNCGCDLEPISNKKLYDCTVPADGKKLNKDESMKVVACPKEYPLGTKIYIDGLGEVVCRDRGGAINENRIDVRMGYGEDAQNNWEKVIAGKQFGYLIK